MTEIEAGLDSKRAEPTQYVRRQGEPTLVTRAKDADEEIRPSGGNSP